MFVFIFVFGLWTNLKIHCQGTALESCIKSIDLRPHSRVNRAGFIQYEKCKMSAEYTNVNTFWSAKQFTINYIKLSVNGCMTNLYIHCLLSFAFYKLVNMWSKSNHNMLRFTSMVGTIWLLHKYNFNRTIHFIKRWFDIYSNQKSVF